jgi:NADH-quinone oxidoreductase subunit E
MMSQAELINITRDILSANETRPERLIPILRQVQDACGYLPECAIHRVAAALGIPASTIYGVATFYTHFTLQPKGKYLIKVCDGTACHVKRSTGIIEAIEGELGISRTGGTTGDGLFTLETVACLGACGLAPVVVINDKVYGAMTPEKTVQVLRGIIAAEEASA